MKTKTPEEIEDKVDETGVLVSLMLVVVVLFGLGLQIHQHWIDYWHGVNDATTAQMARDRACALGAIRRQHRVYRTDLPVSYMHALDAELAVEKCFKENDDAQ